MDLIKPCGSKLKGSICWNEKIEKIVRVFKYCCDGYRQVNDQCLVDNDFIMEKNQVKILLFKMILLFALSAGLVVFLVVLICLNVKYRLKFERLAKKTSSTRQAIENELVDQVYSESSKFMNQNLNETKLKSVNIVLPSAPSTQNIYPPV